MNQLYFKHLPAGIQPRRSERQVAFLLYYNIQEACPINSFHIISSNLVPNTVHGPSSEKKKKKKRTGLERAL